MASPSSSSTLRIKSSFGKRSSLSRRKYFTKLKHIVSLPNLIGHQVDSYEWFMKDGLRELLDEVSPITDFSGKDLELNFLDYYLDEPKYDEVTSRERNVSFEAPLRCNVRLTNKHTGEIKEQEVYLGEFPLITDRGTFIINGVERVVVSQLIRSPGVFFTSTYARGRHWFGAKVIPSRGAWLEIETDQSGIIWVKIDRKRKAPMSMLLRVFGLATDAEILEKFSDIDTGEIRYIEETLNKDTAKEQSEAYREIYKRLRPGDLATVENAKQMLEAMFFDSSRYDFGRVGRYKMNMRLDLECPNDPEHRVLRPEDVFAIVRELLRLNNDVEALPDDIDHLGNRRVRLLGELVQERMRVGLSRMERIVKDRMSTLDMNTVVPVQLVNARPVMASVKEFFASSQLSQFMDQINPLAELEHKRRLSAMGPGGLTRERAGFEVRDVHRSHYGRICPIQTPEGPNIGLVGHLASYARINEYGFIETPYLVVKKTKVTEEIVYLTADKEERAVIANASAPLTDAMKFEGKRVQARIKGQVGLADADDVTHIDVSPKQCVSIATSLIPFLEHDDAQRALMGSNMQRQAVACVVPQAPVVGTGIEDKAAKDSGQVILAREDGEVIEVDAAHITIKNSKGKKDTYFLHNFTISNASTALNQHPRVQNHQKVKKGDLLADGTSTDAGELALGQNVLVAFMPWRGANYEDAIIISHRVVKDDRYTSVHIEDFTIDVRDTKLGAEVVTRDIPNVGEDKLSNLDEEGIIRIGAEVKSGDILVGKITPKGESDLTAEERLLRSIFGEKARDVKDSSLYLQHGEHGKVIDIKVFSRENGDKLPSGVIKTIQISIAQLRKIQVGDKLAGRHGNKGVISTILPEEDMPYLEDGTPVDIILNPLGVVSRMNLGQLLETHLGWAAKKLGYNVASPSLDGVSQDDIRSQLKEAGLPEDGKVHLRDGRTGEQFDYKASVGIIYMLKLNHLVEDKIHMRSIGPYSLITQQPLGGKAQFGGQRFGEMEVWALEGYGAAYTLQELLTIKSDDVVGRSKAYESIVKGEELISPNIPASFHVLVHELKALCLDVDLLGIDDTEEKHDITPEARRDLHKKGVVVEEGDEKKEEEVEVPELDFGLEEEDEKKPAEEEETEGL